MIVLKILFGILAVFSSIISLMCLFAWVSGVYLQIKEKRLDLFVVVIIGMITTLSIIASLMLWGIVFDPRIVPS